MQLAKQKATANCEWSYGIAIPNISTNKDLTEPEEIQTKCNWFLSFTNKFKQKKFCAHLNFFLNIEDFDQ